MSGHENLDLELPRESFEKCADSLPVHLPIRHESERLIQHHKPAGVGSCKYDGCNPKCEGGNVEQGTAGPVQRVDGISIFQETENGLSLPPSLYEINFEFDGLNENVLEAAGYNSRDLVVGLLLDELSNRLDNFLSLLDASQLLSTLLEPVHLISALLDRVIILAFESGS